MPDTDDDNFLLMPYKYFPDHEGSFKYLLGQERYNVYKEYTDVNIWPRGLGYQFDEVEPEYKTYNSTIGIWQGLADDDPMLMHVIVL